MAHFGRYDHAHIRPLFDRAPLSAMIQGNDTPNLQVAFYGEVSEAQRAVETFLQQHFAGR